MREDEGTLGEAGSVEAGGHTGRAPQRPRHCWEIVRQLPGLQFNCEECYAYFVQQDCWTLWALRRPGFKPCCQKKGDCTECAVLIERMRPESNEHLQIERRRPLRPAPTTTKRICNYLQLYQTGESVEGDQRHTQIARALQMRNADFRCRLRGVHLDMGYVNDVCVSRNVEDCVFLDEDRPDVQIRLLPMAKGPGIGEKPSVMPAPDAPSTDVPPASPPPSTPLRQER